MSVELPAGQGFLLGVEEPLTANRRLLFGIAYRMLGSVADAEDIVQETWLRWQRQNAATIRSPKAWLVSTTARLCIDQLRSAKRTREEYYGVWLPEPIVETRSPSSDERAALADSLATAFMLMLETLSPVERAVFLLHEVFAYSHAEIAPIVGKTEANCRQIARRAGQRLKARPKVVQPPTVQARRVVEQFVKATLTGEMNSLLALLETDATLYSDGGGRVAAAAKPIKGAERIGRFFLGIRKRIPAKIELRFANINGQPGVLMLSEGTIFNAVSFELDGGRVRGIYIVRNPEKLAHLSGAQPSK